VRRFDGVFSADRLPDNLRLLVCNTDPAHRPGEHWLVMYVDDEGRFGEYFDSLGRPPHDAFRRYLDKHCRHWSYNDRQLQSVVSRFCGHYCVFYRILRSCGRDMRRIVGSFSSDAGFNDVPYLYMVSFVNNERKCQTFYHLLVTHAR